MPFPALQRSVGLIFQFSNDANLLKTRPGTFSRTLNVPKLWTKSVQGRFVQFKSLKLPQIRLGCVQILILYIQCKLMLTHNIF